MKRMQTDCGRDCACAKQSRVSRRLGFWGAVVTVLLVGGVWLKWFAPAAAEGGEIKACISREQVQQATEEERCLVIYQGGVYDLTEGAKMWGLEGHVDKHPCGQEYDLETIKRGPHGEEVMDEFYLTELCADKVETSVSKEEISGSGGGLVKGISLRTISVYLALTFFVLNFATCYAMPWSRKGAPWAGERPGEDGKDSVGHFPLTHWHPYFAWGAIGFLGLHGILGFLCLLKGVCW